jgi:hypothetical protein
MNMSPPILAEFAAPAEGAEVRGDVVRRKAPVIFRAGDYDFVGAPSYRMTPEDIRRAVETFEPVPVVDTHVPSHFTRKLTAARLVKLTPNADHTEFGGELELDRWCHDLFKGEPLACSVTFDRATKKVKNLALVPNPRIPDAAIEAAFAEEEARRQHTPHGQAAMQRMHDTAAEAGARCNPDAAFTADHEGDALQEMHDTAVRHGAVCKTYPEPEKPKKEAPMSTPATPAPAPPPELEARFAAQDKALADLKAETDALKRDNEALKRDNVALQKDSRAAHERRIKAEAAAFAREQQRAGIISRAERDDTEAEFAEAALEDLDAPREVTFSDAEGKPAKGGRVDRLRARYARRPADPMRRERVADRDGDEALFSRDRPAGEDDGEMSQEEHERLLAGTERGRQILRERAAQNAGANAANGRK